MTREFIDFVNAHKDEDTARLLLSAARYPAIDMAAAVQQIEGLRTAQEKWPGLLECGEFLYPPRLNREQASSEKTAVHKASLCLSGTAESHSVFRIADLTGGMGIDTFALAGWGAERQVQVEVDYVEQDRSLCELAKHNAAALGLSNIRFHCCDSLEWLQQQDRHFDLFFIDPARRDKQGHKVAAFEDCTPDIVAHQALLFSKSSEVMVKASPMIDITLGSAQLHNVSDIYVIAVQGECKEVLFLCRPSDGSEPRIHCHHLHHGVVDDFVFTRQEEAQTQVAYATEVKKYLYEPHAALMKAGPFKLLSQREGLEKLAQHTHLYTSDSFVQHFPGRIFSVLKEVSLNKKNLAAAIPNGKAHVIVRNYPAHAEELQRQLGLKEGGDDYVIATTVGTLKTGFVCRKVL